MSVIGRIGDSLDARITRLTERNEALETYVRVMATGFDHDPDAHTHRTFCPVCEAEKLLATKNVRKEDEDADGYRSGQAGLPGH